MPRYRKKPIVIEAVQWTGDNWQEMGKHIGVSVRHMPGRLAIETPDSALFYVNPTDWVIKGIDGIIYACPHAVFAQTYDPMHSKDPLSTVLNIRAPGP